MTDDLSCSVYVCVYDFSLYDFSFYSIIISCEVLFLKFLY